MLEDEKLILLYIGVVGKCRIHCVSKDDTNVPHYNFDAETLLREYAIK